ERGDEVTIILTRQETEPTLIDESWRQKYAALGIALIELHSTPPSPDRWCDAWPARLSEQVAPHLRAFDIAYFQDWANVAFHAARAKRFDDSEWPVLVTVLHGPSSWIRVANRKYPSTPEDLHVEFVERYSARHSDHVIAPSRYILDWAIQNGWKFSSQPQVLGLPFRPEPSPPLEGRVKPRQLVFFGRLETRKGFDLFAAAVRRVRDSLAGLERIVLLGAEEESGAADRLRRQLSDLAVEHISHLDNRGASEYFVAHRAESLVVVPSPVENFPYAVIETSLIPGLQAIYSRGGGVPEILGGKDDARLFDPHPEALAEKILERWYHPLDAAPPYDYAPANDRWLQFHDDALAKRVKRAP